MNDSTHVRPPFSTICASILLVLAAAPIFSPAARAGDPAIVRTEFIYATAPFPACHASTLAETADGDLVAAWFGGTQERAPDVCIWASRCHDGEWSAPVEVANGVQADGTRHPCWNPVLFQPRHGALMLFYKVGPDPQKWWGLLRTSDDAGTTWSDPARLPDGYVGPIKNKPVQLSNGDILCPSSQESSTEGAVHRTVWRAHFERTSDLGKTWAKAAPPAKDDATEINAIQPSILLHGGDQLQAIGRTRGGHLFETWSADSGQTWSPLAYTTLPNPNSGTDAATLSDGRHLLIYNHTVRGRSPLNLAVSRDGKAWDAALVLEETPGKEYSYPAIIQTRDGLVHITYTWERKRIKHVVVDPTKLTATAIEGGAWPAGVSASIGKPRS